MIAGGVGAVAAEQVRPTDMPPDACQEVIDRCCALGSDNPIRLIHDVGAGGLANALPELVHQAGRGALVDALPHPGARPLLVHCAAPPGAVRHPPPHECHPMGSVTLARGTASRTRLGPKAATTCAMRTTLQPRR